MHTTTPFVHYRTCNLCEAMCGLEITYVDKKIISIKGDKLDPFSQGYICPKAVALQDIFHDSDRLKRPRKKWGTGWKDISWEEAFDLVAEKLKATIATYGEDAVAVYQGNPSVHNFGTMALGASFFKTLKTKNRYSATSVDQLPHHFVSQMMLGHYLMLPVPDIDRTHYFLVLGANPIVSNGSLMSAAGMPTRLKKLQERGGKLVVVDPRRTETAAKADLHVPIRPGKDVYFLASILHELLIEKLVDLNELASWVKSDNDLIELFRRFTPEATAPLTGVPPETVKRIAQGFSQADSAVCYGRMGVSVQEHGTLCQWIIYLINIVSGNFDKAGGYMFANPAVDIVDFIAPKGTYHRYNRWQSRVRKYPEVSGELPVATLAEECLTPGEGQIKAFVCSAGNPVLSTPNGIQLEKALEGLDFMVSFDIYLNETNKHADVILPPATGLETDHYDLAFYNLAVRNTAKFSPALYDPEPGALQDWQIFKELGKRMKKVSVFGKILNWFLSPRLMLDLALRKGPYNLNLRKLKKNPHGLDLGALESCLPQKLFTPDQMLDLTPELFVDGLNKLNLKALASQNGKLLLIGRRDLRSNNSWMHNSKRLVKGPVRCTVIIHPDDAKSRKIQTGDEVTVKSKVGQIRLPAEVSDEIAPGVVSIPHGWGHHRKKTGLKVAEQHAGVSINDLTDDHLVDKLSGNAALSGVEVEVGKCN